MKLKTSGLYTCELCFEPFKSRNHFDLHLFEKHEDIDVKAKYKKDIESLINKGRMKQLRAPLLTMMATDKFN